MCEAYVIPFLFGSSSTVCHPCIDVHFLKCFLCDLYNVMYSDIDTTEHFEPIFVSVTKSAYAEKFL